MIRSLKLKKSFLDSRRQRAAESRRPKKSSLLPSLLSLCSELRPVAVLCEICLLLLLSRSRTIQIRCGVVSILVICFSAVKARGGWQVFFSPVTSFGFSSSSQHLCLQKSYPATHAIAMQNPSTFEFFFFQRLLPRLWEELTTRREYKHMNA